MKGYGEEILRMEDIVKTFDLGGGKKLTASDHVTISLHKGETLGIVGESGSGKSTLAKILTRLYTMDSGRILLHGKDMTALKGEEFRQARKNIQMVFQDPSTAFDPKQRVRDIICEPLMNYGLIGKEKVDEKILRNYIKNIYATLLERGMYGTYIYVCNESLRDYFKRFFTFVPHRTKG